ncbi:MAG: hypothetical protein ACJAWR_002078 [Flavobacteriales bacterium]|jgi:uncharacterized protein YjbI with pentapeptide repeats
MEEKEVISDIESFKKLCPNRRKINLKDKVIDFEFHSSSFFVEKSKQYDDVELTNCVFNNCADFSNTTLFKSSITNTKFKGTVNFSHSNFAGNAKFYQSQFCDKVNFENAKFQELADFWGVIFYKNVIFFKTNFEKASVFAFTEFLGNVLFTYTSFQGASIFKNTKFRKLADFSLAIISGSLSLFNFKSLNYDNSYIDSIVFTSKDISEEDYDKYVSSIGLIPMINLRETFRIIKHSLNSQNNIIEANYFGKLEKRVYLEELNNDNSSSLLKKILDALGEALCYIFIGFLIVLFGIATHMLVSIAITTIISLILILKPSFINDYSYLFTKTHKDQTIGDYIIFQLNRYSNNHGSSWSRSIIFTIIISISCYYPLILLTDNYELGFDIEVLFELIPNYIEFLNPIHKVSSILNACNKIEAGSKWLFYLIDFIGRILVGFGIYQTIQAFRRFK